MPPAVGGEPPARVTAPLVGVPAVPVMDREALAGGRGVTPRPLRRSQHPLRSPEPLLRPSPPVRQVPPRRGLGLCRPAPPAWEAPLARRQPAQALSLAPVPAVTVPVLGVAATGTARELAAMVPARRAADMDTVREAAAMDRAEVATGTAQGAAATVPTGEATATDPEAAAMVPARVVATSDRGAAMGLKADMAPPVAMVRGPRTSRPRRERTP